jgi:hypothetical protein
MRLSARQRKDQARIRAWLEGQPFQESRNSAPCVPDLAPERVFAEYVPPDFAGAQSGREPLGQFFTPEEMAVDLLGVFTDFVNWEDKTGVRLADVAAGIGHLLRPLDSWAFGAELHGFEIEQQCCRIGKRLLPDVHWHHGSTFHFLDDFRTYFDFVASNFPFGPAADDCGTSEIGWARIEHQFLELTWHVLKPGGRAQIIMVEDFADLMPPRGRAWFDEHFEVVWRSYHPLAGRFFGTDVRVHGYMLMRKPQPEELASWNTTDWAYAFDARYYRPGPHEPMPGPAPKVVTAIAASPQCEQAPMALL